MLTHPKPSFAPLSRDFSFFRQDFHPQAPELRVLGNPLRLSHTPPRRHSPPPDLGQHSKEIAAELGYTEEEIEALIEKGIIA